MRAAFPAGTPVQFTRSKRLCALSRGTVMTNYDDRVVIRAPSGRIARVDARRVTYA